MTELYNNKSEWFNKLLAYIWSHFDINIDVKLSTYKIGYLIEIHFFSQKRWFGLQIYKTIETCWN